MLDEVVAAAGRVQDATHTVAEPVHASAANGWLEVELGGDGRLASVNLDPGMLRMPLERIGAAIVEAVNAALDEQKAQHGQAVAAVDLSQVITQLKQVQAEAVPQMRSFIDAMTQAQRDAAARPAR
ncbi:YbaB/EbfC family nucleoid-associated protein [Micromonospora sp. RB23]